MTDKNYEELQRRNEELSRLKNLKAVLMDLRQQTDYALTNISDVEAHLRAARSRARETVECAGNMSERANAIRLTKQYHELHRRALALEKDIEQLNEMLMRKNNPLTGV